MARGAGPGRKVSTSAPHALAQSRGRAHGDAGKSKRKVKAKPEQQPDTTSEDNASIAAHTAIALVTSQARLRIESANNRAKPGYCKTW